MPTDVEYALMAGAAYDTSRHIANLIPLPASTGWSRLGDPEVEAGIAW